MPSYFALWHIETNSGYMRKDCDSSRLGQAYTHTHNVRIMKNLTDAS